MSRIDLAAWVRAAADMYRLTYGSPRRALKLVIVDEDDLRQSNLRRTIELDPPDLGVLPAPPPVLRDAQEAAILRALADETLPGKKIAARLGVAAGPHFRERLGALAGPERALLLHVAGPGGGYQVSARGKSALAAWGQSDGQSDLAK